MRDIRPTVRRRISRMLSYLIFLGLIVALAFTADWALITKVFLNKDIALGMFPGVFRAALNTILYTLIAFVIGLVLAIVLALMKLSSGPFKWFAVGFIELFRGLPALLTIFIMAFAVPMAFESLRALRIEGVYYGLIGLVFVTGAYTAEIIRAGIQAVPRGQHEAARSLGMSQMRTMITVILPQAIRIVIPPLTNELVMLLKDTSLLFIAGATKANKELTQFGRDGMSSHFNSTPLLVVAVFYLIITIPLTYLVARLEKKMAVKQ
ncbi:MAG: amino acid ABC transporter permease [Propionibacteriaceae bacterium]|nr:amino acid ABC transporter permease [Propionibacteriaceae bacterium]